MNPSSVREAGLLLHLTSLPGEGRLDTNARQFIRWAAAAGFHVWQILPVGPTHSDGSPYLSLSAHAGSGDFISVPDLRADPAFNDGWFGTWLGTQSCFSALQLAKDWKPEFDIRNFEGFQDFFAANADWVEPYARFMLIRDAQGGRPWWEWPEALRDCRADAMGELIEQNIHTLDAYLLEQYLFDRQWYAMKNYANERGIRLFGDMALYVAHDSVDVWSNPGLFAINAAGHVSTQAGVPPDAFSATGQLWGNPVFNWPAHEAEDFSWWRRRIQGQGKRFDMLRIDHFRGLEAYWAVPAGDETAMGGKWVLAPGKDMLARATADVPDLQLVAEDLGTITPEVDALRHEFNMPGMRVMEFAFDGGDDNPHRLRNQTVDSVVYTGTHDNDTVLGWYRALDEAQRSLINAELNIESESGVVTAMVDAALNAPGYLAIVPVQDVLGLGSEARMNTPATVEKNWRWKLDWAQMRGVTTESWRERLAASGRVAS